MISTSSKKERSHSPVQSLSHDKRRLIVTIDGTAGSGKSTVARKLAAHLGYAYLDTGALYRAVAWKVKKQNIGPTNPAAVVALLPSTNIRIQMGLKGEVMRVWIDGQEVTSEIRTPDISFFAAHVSAIPEVRAWLLPKQHKEGTNGGIVAEGRDLGTVVFPEADVKFFLDANVDTRAARRRKELAAAGQSEQKIANTKSHIKERDERDRSREASPMVPAKDAQSIDTSALTAEQVVEQMMQVISSKL